eukprot:CAMPEP_0119119066 /NCGR_PEP_ID=MMETSP1310-20130426/721_1 /TAXON_ID=464262 /ORGANISM="Genus nov. species nov., Strain RCC2339" /LENGTH=424 /DNA_ID=CAMNT_0007108479 /DNA_START=103 /DNA_END=1377 /DNA_ORIENTATION=+
MKGKWIFAVVMVAYYELVVGSSSFFGKGDQVVRVSCTEEQAAVIEDQWHRGEMDLDLWVDAIPRSGEFDIRVSDDAREWLEHIGVKVTTKIADVTAVVKAERERLAKRPRADPTDPVAWFSDYRTWEEIQEFVTTMAAEYPDLAQVKEIGTTYYGLPIRGLVMSGEGDPAAKPQVVLNGLQHAREWISGATMQYISYSLLSNYTTNSTVREMLDHFTFSIFPVINGDGYNYTWTERRLWRKNLAPAPNGEDCKGVDINRNWGYRFDTGGASDRPCSDTYHGPYAFSEPENSAIANYVTNLPNALCYCDVHAYSQLWMSPWSSRRILPKNYLTQVECAKEATAALASVFGTEFDVGNTYRIIYEASGGSNDYTYGDVDVIYSFAIELRDTGEYGFLLPAEQIIPSGLEFFQAIMAMTEYFVKQGY